MGVDRGEANAAPVLCFPLEQHAAPIKSEDKILRNCLKKGDKICARNSLECTKLHHFFFFFKFFPELALLSLFSIT